MGSPRGVASVQDGGPTPEADDSSSSFDRGFDGKWIAGGSRKFVSIKGRRIQWQGGILWKMDSRYSSGTAFTVRVDGDDHAGMLGGNGELRWSDGDVRIGDSRPARAEGARLHGVAAPGGCAGPPRGPCGRAARTADGQLWVEDGELSASGHAPDSGSDGGGVDGIPHAPFNGHHGRRSVNVVRFTGVPVDALLEALAQPAVVFADMPASAASSSGNGPSGGMPGRGPAPGRASR